jgi:tetratricopeptide (TPR) repeat protein
MCNLGVTLSQTNLRAALEYIARSADEHLKNGAIRMAINALNNLADTAWQLGELDVMSAALDRLGTIVRDRIELGFPLAWYRQNVGRLLRCRREFDAAGREFEKLAAELDGSRETDDTRVLLMLTEVYDELALTYLASGRLTEARFSLDRNADVARRSRKKQWTLLHHHWIDACVHRAQGHPDEARLALARSHEIYCEKLGRLVDPGVRASYREQPVNRALLNALEHDEWPSPQSPCVIAFPGPASASSFSRTSAIASAS